MFDIDWWSLVLPFSYITLLGGSLFTFSTVYRKRKASQAANLEPWFPEHVQRDVYLSLLHAEDVPKTLIRAALLRRAVEDIRRLMQIRPARQPLNMLLQRGSVGEDLSHRLTAAEKEIDLEIRDVINEANALVPGWGATIFQSANEITANTVLRTRLKEIETRAEEEQKAYPRQAKAPESEKAESVISKEDAAESKDSSVKGSVKGSVKAISDDEGVHVELTSPSATPGGSKKKKKGKK